MNKFNCLLSLLFLASCMNSTKETKPKKIVIENNNIESRGKKCNFSDFVKMFTMDSVFQKEHVKFPLEIVLYGTDPDDSDSISYVKESDWYFVTLNDSVIDGIKFMHQIDTANCLIKLCLFKEYLRVLKIYLVTLKITNIFIKIMYCAICRHENCIEK